MGGAVELLFIFLNYLCGVLDFFVQQCIIELIAGQENMLLNVLKIEQCDGAHLKEFLSSLILISSAVDSLQINANPFLIPSPIVQPRYPDPPHPYAIKWVFLP